MNWKRGFKRITHLLAIVVAVACGGIAGFLPFQKYDDANTVKADELLWLQRAEEYYEERVTEEGPANPEETIIEMALKHDMNMTDFIDQLKKDDLERRIDEVLKRQRRTNEILEKHRKTSFWYSLSRAELIGMVVLYGLGGAVAGYVGTWVILWYGGLAIFILVGWLILGFADKKPKDEQKQ